nr:kielin/chordin-like protein isoform X1 [Procambarus clarkii]
MGKKECFSPGGGVICMVLLMCIGSIASHPSNDSNCFKTSRKVCVDPEDCCKFKESTQEFDECCKEHGCCPTNCEDIEGAVGETCNMASSCCRFPPQSRQFQYCCNLFGCCPVCQDFSTGCCYNGAMYQWGATVEEFPDRCLGLVCAAKASDVEPFFAAVIVPVKLPCGEHLVCQDTLNCVDQTGLLQAEGATWHPDECSECSCKNGIVECQDTVQCPVPLHEHCIPIPRPCCPLWNCSAYSSGCVDDFGQSHELESSWYSTPCFYHTCTTTGIVTRIEDCANPEPPHPDCDLITPDGECCPQWHCRGCTDTEGNYHELGQEWPGSDDPCTSLKCTSYGIKKNNVICVDDNPPHSGCFAYTPVGDCCPKWNCSGCVDENMNYYAVGEEWATTDPCIVFQCTVLGIQLKTVSCAATGTPFPGCKAYIPEGECCPKFNCSGCVDSTGHHQLFEVWQTDPCTTHLCTKTGIQTKREECSLGVIPHPTCTKYTPPNKCCLEWNCTGCFDSENNFHEIDSKWKRQDPCLIFKCTKGGISMERVNCTKVTKPHPGCSEHTPEGECCPVWKCSTCIDDEGVHHSLYEVWQPDPCTTNFCTKTGIQSTRETCELGPAPHPSCQMIIPPEECCPEWHCRACSDSSGGYHEIGSEWSSEDPCLKFVCTESGIIIKRLLCTRIERHHSSCYEYKPKGECCFKWNCSGCIDDTGADHPLYDLWKTDPCTTHYCTKTGIETTRETCELGLSPHHSCKIFTPPGECCSEWQCSACVDGSGKYHELGQKWRTGDPCLVYFCTDKGISIIRSQCEDSPAPHPDCYKYTPKGECCPKWNCSGCVFEGVYHPLYDVWKSDPCTTHTCTTRGVNTSRQDCEHQPAPHPTCRSVNHVGQCCPAWECSGCLMNDVMHKIGDNWTSGDPCMVFLCTVDGIKVNRINCTKQTAPHPGCSLYTPVKECCPKWNCSGCVDGAGKFHQLYDLWRTDHCTTHFCTKTGIETRLKDCHLGPAPDASCVEVTSPGECCPRWQCKGCLDREGKYHPIGQAWSTEDPCMRLVCTLGGISIEHINCTAASRPYPDCFEYTPLGDCCPKWNCSGCVAPNGTYHSLYDVWKTDLCTTQMCTKTGIRTTKENCTLGPAPHSTCERSTPPGKCCPEWNCRGCLDSTGKYHDLGTEWSTADPCMLLVCTVGGIVPRIMACVDKLKPHPDCTKYVPVLECCSKWNCSGCTDYNGTYRPLNHVWKPEPCTTEVCTEEGIKTTVKKCDLGPAPHEDCQQYTPPGDCCPDWKCSGCMDDLGTYHKLNEVWHSDPCTTNKCTNSGITTTVKDCHLGPALHPTCKKYTPPKACCPEWNCTGCTDGYGTYHPLHDIWESGPCTTNKCTSQGINTTVKECNLGHPPHVDCQQYTPSGDCCPEWKCSGCTDNNGTYYQLHQVWESDPCTTRTCTTDGIKTNVKYCGLEPAPHSTCQKVTPSGECCPEWRCSGCTDNGGKYHPLYHVWSSDPCTNHTCTIDGIETVVKTCYTGPAPHQSCQKYTPLKDCCPRWRCRGCFDFDGIFHDLGERWSTDDPCVFLVCTEKGISRNVTECVDSSPLHPGCFKYKALGECCSKWNCSGCTDANGTHHALHEVWKSDDCTTHTCQSDGIKTTVTHCYLPPAPHTTCQKHIQPGECCPLWKCSGCMDTSGAYHPLYDVWKTDACTTHVCTSGGIKTTVKTCDPTPAPHHTCLKDSPPGECCPRWKCSGCRDANGTYHQLHQEWSNDNCTKHKCTSDGIKTTVKDCRLGPAPHISCQEHTHPGECCPKWKCSGCTDDNGTYHALYDIWSSDACTTHACTSDGIKTSVKICDMGPAPHSSCHQHTPTGECCPRWKCGVCVDDQGTHHGEGESWQDPRDPCKMCTCTQGSLSCSVMDCAPPPPWPCDPPRLPGQCCPNYCPSPVSTSSFFPVILDGCVDDNGTRRKYGEKWTHPSDSCREFQCGRMGKIQRFRYC